ncbi:hypothetical protein BRCON_1506 [Candidatus Sumerlaea chitinivorans]|uniref:NlpC/P60 domain-containing protein n=1 Tax=Sumerlaea chitinivorans TaxID=2250252 RepID=A0A2Z4Y723_SUMC1|nr:hypothetical protein BRCON_1506 [Candidatus Sumerlaea chitinivorans]
MKPILRSILVCLSLVSALYDPPNRAWGSEKPETSAPPTRQVSGDEVPDFISPEEWRRLSREDRARRSQRLLLKRIEPEGVGKPDRLALYIERFADIVIFDRRLAVFHVETTSAQQNPMAISLRGEVTEKRYKRGIEQILSGLGFEIVRNEIVVLPTMPEPQRYAVATTTAASLRREPRGDAEQVNSVALGGPLRLLRPARSEDITTRTYGRRAGNRREPDGPVTRPDEWFLAQSSEGYVGFVHKKDVRFTEDFRAPQAYLDRPTTLTLPNGRKIVAPCGASLYRGVDGKWRVGGVDVELPHDTLSAPGRDVRLTSQTLVERAQPLLGTQYVWGGVTEEGIDCSGFTQFLFKTYGIVLPRDAEEQAIVGQIVAFGQDVVRTAQPGDLIFFMNEHGKVNHVAISLGGDRILHSSGRNVHFASLLGQSESNEERLLDRVLWARRVLLQK